MPTSLVHRRDVLAGMAASAFLLVGCKKAVDEQKASAAGALTIGVGADVLPGQMLRLVTANLPVVRLVFDTLTDLSGGGGAPNPRLATSWNWENGGRDLRMRLTPNATFHTGRPFTAKDVAFTIAQVQGPTAGSQGAPIAKRISSVQIVSDHEVVLHFVGPTPTVFDLFELMPIVDQDTYAELAKGGRVVGTGPFTWGSWQPGASLTLKRNARYWKNARTGIATIEVKIYKQAQTMINALKAGEVDLVVGVPRQQIAALSGKSGLTLVTSKSGSGAYHAGFNVTTPPFDDKAVRQAIGYAIDRDRILNQVFAGVGTVSSLWWPVNTPGYQTSAARHYTYQPERARSMLAAAGAAGATIPLAINASLPISTAIFNIVQYDLTQVGLKVVPQLYQGAEFVLRNQKANLDGMWINNFGQNNLSPSTLIASAAPLRPAKNTSHYSDPEYTRLVGAVASNSAADVERLGAFMLDAAFDHNLVLAPTVWAMSSELSGFGYSDLDAVMLTDATVSA